MLSSTLTVKCVNGLAISGGTAVIRVNSTTDSYLVVRALELLSKKSPRVCGKPS